MLNRTNLQPAGVASVPAPAMHFLPLGHFGRSGALAGARRRAAVGNLDNGDPLAVADVDPCLGDELWMWRFLLAGRPFGATGVAAGGPDDGATWLSTHEHALARRMPTAQLRHRFMAERIALRWIFGRWYRCAPAAAPVPEPAPGVSRYEVAGPGGPVWIDMAHAGLWLFVVMGQGPLALSASASAPSDDSPDDPLAAGRAAAHQECLTRLVDQPTLDISEIRSAPNDAAPVAHGDVPLLAHPYASVPFAGRTRYLYDISVSTRLTVVAARDAIVHRMRGYGWQS